MSKNSCAAAATAFVLIGLCCVWTPPRVQAHPLSQGRFELIVTPSKVTLWARVTLEQVLVQQTLPVNDQAQVVTQTDAYRSHGAYLLKHIFLTADGQALTGRIASFVEPDSKTVYVNDAQKEFVTFEIEFPLTVKPHELRLRQNVLHEIDYTENNPWESTYITGIRQENGASQENLLLSSTNTLSFTCDWTAPPTPAATVTSPAPPQNVPPAALNQPIPPVREIPWAFIAGLGVVVALVLSFRVAKKSGSRKRF